MCSSVGIIMNVQRSVDVCNYGVIVIENIVRLLRNLRCNESMREMLIFLVL